MCVCVCIHGYVDVHNTGSLAYVWKWVQRSEVHSGCCSSGAIHLVFWDSLSVGPKTHKLEKTGWPQSSNNQLVPKDYKHTHAHLCL